jgi:hypothetical protein
MMALDLPLFFAWLAAACALDKEDDEEELCVLSLSVCVYVAMYVGSVNAL